MHTASLTVQQHLILSKQKATRLHSIAHMPPPCVRLLFDCNIWAMRVQTYPCLHALGDDHHLPRLLSMGSSSTRAPVLRAK